MNENNVYWSKDEYSTSISSIEAWRPKGYRIHMDGQIIRTARFDIYSFKENGALSCKYKKGFGLIFYLNDSPILQMVKEGESYTGESKAIYLHCLSEKDVKSSNLTSKIESIALYQTKFSSCETISCLTKIRDLDLSGTGVMNIDHLSGFEMLESLNLEGCSVTSLEPLGDIPKLQRLNIKGCNRISNLEPILNKRMSTGNGVLSLAGCESIVSLKGIQSFMDIQELDLSYCGILNDLSEIKELPGLKKLILRECRSVYSLKDVKQCINLEFLDLSECRSIKSISFEGELKNLKVLNAKDIRHLHSFYAQKLPELRSIFISSSRLKKISFGKGLNSLNEVDLSCGMVSGVENLPNLKCFSIKRLKGMEFLSLLSSVKKLDIEFDSDAKGIDFSNLNKELRALNVSIWDKPTQEMLDSLSCLSKLEELSLYLPLKGLVDLDFISNLRAIKKLSIHNECSNKDTAMLNLDHIGELNNLEVLVLGINVYNIKPLANLRHLKDLTIHSDVLSDISPLSGLSNLKSLAIYCKEVLESEVLINLLKQIEDFEGEDDLFELWDALQDG